MTELSLDEPIMRAFGIMGTWLRGAIAIISMFLVTVVCTGIVLLVHSLSTYPSDIYLNVIAILWVIFLICSFIVVHITKQKMNGVHNLWDVEDGNR